MNATKGQIGRLQTVYSQLARRDIGLDNTREARLEWASKLCLRAVTSFSSLTASEAGHLIDQAQQAIGTKAPLKKRLNARDARRAGTDGRHDGEEFETQPELVGAADIARIEDACRRLEWDNASLTRFLESKRSPFARRTNKSIRTKADANQVWWALKRILKRTGKWEERSAA